MNNDLFQEFFQTAVENKKHRYPSWTYPEPLPKPKVLPRRFKPIAEVLQENGFLSDDCEKIYRMMGWKPLVLKRKNLDNE